jgi:hypothetical protein
VNKLATIEGNVRRSRSSNTSVRYGRHALTKCVVHDVPSPAAPWLRIVTCAGTRPILDSVREACRSVGYGKLIPCFSTPSASV